MTEQIKQRQPLIELKDVTKTYHDGKRKDVFAVSNFNLTLYEGETLGLVGESGCGKSTIGNMLVHLFTPDEGSILFRGQDIASMNEREFHPLRKEIQMVFQDPYSSLNPRKKIGWLLEEPLKIHRKDMKKEERKAKVEEILKEVGLDAEYANRYPKNFRRTAPACQHCSCILMNPAFLVADEPVSALDVSVQAQILNLMRDFKKISADISFISHDLGVVSYLSDRIGVMYLGHLLSLAQPRKFKILHIRTQRHCLMSMQVLLGEIPPIRSTVRMPISY
ncbi:MAG: ATP-binding cassette domain-containing protein [Lachnospiraceae bacterium]